MEDDVPRELQLSLAILGACIVLTNLCSLPFSRDKLCTVATMKKLQQNVGRSLKELSASLTARQEKQLGDFEQRVREKRALMMYDECKVWLPTVVCLCLVIELCRTWNIINENPRWVGTVSDVLWIFSLVGLTLCRLMPAWFERQNVHHVYSMLLIACTSAAFHKTEHVYQVDILLLVPRLCCTLWCSGPLTGIFCNVVYLAGISMRYREVEGTDEESRQMLLNIWVFCLLQVIFCMIVLPFRQVWKLETARAIVEISETKSELGAVRALLETVCDSVVELDIEYRLHERNTKLSAMLLSEMLAGSCFLRYLGSPEAEEYFIANVTRTIPFAKGLAHSFHVNMRDSAGTQIKMRLFHVPFSVHLKCHHLIGICEIQQASFPYIAQSPAHEAWWLHENRITKGKRGIVARTPLAPDVKGMAPLVSEALARVSDAAGIYADGSISGESSSSSKQSYTSTNSSRLSGVDGGGMPPDIKTEMPEKLTVEADLFSDNLLVTHSTPQFKSIFRLIRGDALVSLFSGQDRELAGDFLKTAGKQGLAGLPIEPLRISMCPRGMKRFGVIVKATLQVKEVAQDFPGRAVALLEFTHLEWKHQRQGAQGAQGMPRKRTLGSPRNAQGQNRTSSLLATLGTPPQSAPLSPAVVGAQHVTL